MRKKAKSKARAGVALLLALGVAFGAAGAAAGAKPKAKRPSFLFIRECGQEFDRALARGDTDGAGAALERLGSRGVEDEVREKQFARAQIIRSLLEEGGRQVEAEEFEGAEATWAELELEREDDRLIWSALWKGSGYPGWLAQEMDGFRNRMNQARDAFAERTKRRFDDSLSAKNWGEAEGCIADLGRIGVPRGALEKRLETAKAAEAASASYERHLGKGEHAEAEGDLLRLEELGIDTAARRHEWRDAYAADCERRFSEALGRREYEGAEALLGTFGKLGEDTGSLSGRIHAKRVEDARGDFEAALAGGRADEAEGHLAILAGLGEDGAEGTERIRQLRLTQRRAEFDRALGKRDYEAAEGLKAAFEGLEEDFGPYAERIRLERIAEIREGLPEAWERRDVRAVRDACGRLQALGDATGDEEERLAEMFAEEIQEAAAAVRKAADGVWKPDFAGADATAAAFRSRWAGVWDGDMGPLDETLRIVRKKYALRAQSTEGPIAGECPEYWLRCSPELLLEEDPEARIEGLKVHLAGVASGVRSDAGGSRYRVSGLYGNELEVETKGAPPPPRQWIYLLAEVRTQDGEIVLAEMRRAALAEPRKPLGGAYAEWLDGGGYDLLLENCFRELAHAPEGKQLKPLDPYDWRAGKRTHMEEYRGK
jgi:hypothetical protein